jgi:hypothetical protein
MKSNAGAKATGPPEPAVCAATNLAMPGIGSLLAKRAVGWPQATLTVTAFTLTAFFGLKFVLWFFQNRAYLFGDESDPIELLQSMWQNVRFALLGMGLFIFSWLWALITNASILRAAKKAHSQNVPPIIGKP